MINKSRLRQKILHLLSQLSIQERVDYENELERMVCQYIQDMGFRKVGLYYSFEPELTTHRLIDCLYHQGIQIYLPVIESHRQMAYAPYRPQEQLENVRGRIWQPATKERIQPEELEMVLVPGLAYTKGGDRLGFGGGYFDRFLQKHSTLHTVSVALPDQILNNLEVLLEPHDQPIEKIFIISLEEELDE